jgi:hypothetical protein
MWLNTGFWLTLLILHGLAAFLLLGALTHQAIAVWAPVRSRVNDFVGRVRAVGPISYGAAVIWLYVITFILGMIVYPDFKMTSWTTLANQHWTKVIDSFEFKEHALAIGLAMLPAYWYYWKPPVPPERDFVRAMLTTVLAVLSWVGFLVGHVLNNIAGIGIGA